MDIWNPDDAVARVRAELSPWRQRGRWFAYGAAAMLVIVLLGKALT